MRNKISVKYVSTRGSAEVVEFTDVLLTGLAKDGGLYVPEIWPELSADQISSFAGKSFADVAIEVIAPFVENSIELEDLKRMTDLSYSSFSHPAVTPIVQTSENEFILELFHGPTLAFKDIAMQLLGQLMGHILEKKGLRATIVGATSGDTGGAACEAFKGHHLTDLFILFPNGRVSEVQRKQMTTVSDSNVYAIAVNGTFDDCQAIVKSLFNHDSFRDQVNLAGVNSINWSRIMTQVVYYFVAGVALGAPYRKVSFTVPTGNFGDVFAGYVAKKMGLPIDRLVIATNVNDILNRAISTGRYEKQDVVATSSPSMDIQVSSNFERLLFDAVGRDSWKVNTMMSNLAQSGSFGIPTDCINYIQTHFDVGSANENSCHETIKQVYSESGYLLDPHTAVAVSVARKISTNDESPMIVLATAHPAKFPETIKKVVGAWPSLPIWMNQEEEKQEIYTVLDSDEAKVEEFILSQLG